MELYRKLAESAVEFVAEDASKSTEGDVEFSEAQTQLVVELITDVLDGLEMAARATDNHPLNLIFLWGQTVHKVMEVLNGISKQGIDLELFKDADVQVEKVEGGVMMTLSGPLGELVDQDKMEEFLQQALKNWTTNN